MPSSPFPFEHVGRCEALISQDVCPECQVWFSGILNCNLPAVAVGFGGCHHVTAAFNEVVNIASVVQKCTELVDPISFTYAAKIKDDWAIDHNAMFLFIEHPLWKMP